MADYKVQLNVFEGPLDLLLYLIKKEEVDIYEVNLTKIATQFIEYVEMMRRLDLDIAGEFLVMAATLMYIKSRELLPVDQQVQVEEEEDPIDPRWDLIRQLVEYKKFKDMAAQLQNREEQMDAVYGRQPGKVELPEPEETEVGKGVSLFDLIQAVSTILKRFQETEKPGTIAEDKWSVSEKIQMIDELIQSRSVVRFSELFAAARSRAEVIVTFLAMLELTRMKKAWLAQSEVFGEIEVSAAPPEAALPGGPVEPPEAETAALPRQQLADADEEFDEAAFLEAQAQAAAANTAAETPGAAPSSVPVETSDTSEPALNSEAEATSEVPSGTTETLETEPSRDEAEAKSEAESAKPSESTEDSAADGEEDADEYDDEDDDDDEAEEASADDFDEEEEDEDDEDGDDEDEFDESDLDGEPKDEAEAGTTERAPETVAETEAPAGEPKPEAPLAGPAAAKAKPDAAGDTEPPASEAPAAPGAPA